MPTPTRAARLIRAHMKKHGLSTEALAAGVGVSAATVYRWLAGMKPKSRATRLSVERFTKGDVPAPSWDQT